MAKNKYAEMTVEQLEAENFKLTAEREAVRQEQLRLTAVMDRKTARRKAEEIAKTLGADEKRELAQVIGTAGVESEEAVGTPGLSD